MLKSRFLANFTAIFLAFSMHTQAADEQPASEATAVGDESSDAIIIDGDKLELHLDRKMRAIGNAVIHRGKQSAHGNVIEYNVQNDELHITGNAHIELGNANLTGPELHMRMSESIGEMRDASITITSSTLPWLQKKHTSNSVDFSKNPDNLQNQQIGGNGTFSSNELSSQNGETPDSLIPDLTTPGSEPRPLQSRADAKVILFEGQDKKQLKDVRYTTCAANVDDWYIKAKELELNDYTESGTAKNAHIEFKGVPILYTPWMSFSFNDQRKSGLLTPIVGSTSLSGFEVTVPFYWNIAPNMDAVLATRELSKRGLQLQGEFRYLEEKFSGKDQLEYLANDNMTGDTRYYANLKHQHNLGNGWSAGYDLEKVSDDQYFSDLSTRIVTTSRINLPQQFNVDYADDTWRFNAIAQKFQTLSNANNDAYYPYERLPQMTLSGNKYFGDVNTNLYTQVAEFDIDKNASVVPTGTRLTAYPSVSFPINRSYGYITPKIGVHHTSYSLNNVANNLESQQRTLPIFSLDSGLFFDRDFKVADRDYSQTIEPRLFYVNIPDKNQSNIPVFDTSKTDLNFSSLFAENQFTGNDRINNANQVSLALTTRMIESSTGTQRLSASIGQRYYFADQVITLPGTNPSNSKSSDVLAGFSAHLRNDWDVDAFWQFNSDSSSSANTNITSRYNPEPGKVLNLSYSYRQDSTNQINISSQWPLGRGWYGMGRVNYSMADNQLIETIAGLEYDAGCWQARTVLQRVTTATAGVNNAFFFQLELGGLASIGADPLAVIKRNIPGYVTTGLIPGSYKQPYNE